jgi:hypothetical protein
MHQASKIAASIPDHWMMIMESKALEMSFEDDNHDEHDEHDVYGPFSNALRMFLFFYKISAIKRNHFPHLSWRQVADAYSKAISRTNLSS